MVPLLGGAGRYWPGGTFNTMLRPRRLRSLRTALKCQLARCMRGAGGRDGWGHTCGKSGPPDKSYTEVWQAPTACWFLHITLIRSGIERQGRQQGSTQGSVTAACHSNGTTLAPPPTVCTPARSACGMPYLARGG